MKGRENARAEDGGTVSAPLLHGRAQPAYPARAVLLGAGGFLARAILAELRRSEVPTLALGSRDVDLSAPGAGIALASRLLPDDAVVMLSAVTPDRSRALAATFANLRMGAALCESLSRSPVAHVVYVSSDAVYPFLQVPVTERSCAAPASAYGVMHRTRETMLARQVSCPLAVVRPTMVYGAGDSHTSYGPTRFRRSAALHGVITLFGEGEECRDFVHVDDVARLVRRILLHESRGVLNLATGVSTSYARLADLVAAQFGRSIRIARVPREVPVTHRAFDVAACRAAFPDFVFTSLEDGLARAHRGAMDDPRGAERGAPE